VAINITFDVAKKITTLYIDDTSIRLMVTRGKRIIKLAEAPLDMNMADISPKVREAELVAKIKHLFETHKIRTKRVIIGLSGLHCLSRPVVLPQLPKAMMEEAITREAKRVLPVPLEQIYLSWQIVSSNNGKMQSFMVAIPRQIADTLLGVTQQVGLKPYLMDVKPLALTRLVKEAMAVLIDVQSREFDIVIMADGVPQPVRTVPFPQEVLSLADKLLLVKDELKRTIQFYNSNNPERTIQSDVTMYVSGELADEPELYESLANDTGYRVLPLTSPLKCPKQLDPAHYLVNIGLALKDLGREATPLLPNVNTLPAPYQPKPFSWGRVVALPAGVCAVGAIALMAMTIQDAAANIDTVNSRLVAANFKIAQRQAQKKDLEGNIASLERALADTKENRKIFTAMVKSFDEEGAIINGNLEATVDELEFGITLKTINHTERGLEITGQSPSEVEVLDYARNLDATDRFVEVTITNMRRVEAEDEGEEMESEGEETEEEGEETEDEGEETEDEGEEIVGDEDSMMEFTLTLSLEEKK
jgi:type IV pilus assembly protein PilM